MAKRVWQIVFKWPPVKVAMLLLLLGGLQLLVRISTGASQLAWHVRDLLQGRQVFMAAYRQPALELQFAQPLSGFYVRENYTTVWLTDEGRLQPCARVLIRTITQAYLHGLDPRDYHAAEIGALARTVDEEPDRLSHASLARLDVLLTDAFITYAYHQYAGRVHDSRNNPGWSRHVQEISPADSLKKIADGAPIEPVLRAFACPHGAYQRLAELLATCIQGNDSVHSERAQQIAANMERWRWLPRVMPERYIMVNVAAYELHAVEHNKDTFCMRVIVGKQQQPTPLFDARMAYLVLNPWWEVPHSIATRELLPEVKKDHACLDRQHIKVFAFSGGQWQEMRSEDIAWEQLSEAYFPYRLRQSPGAWNALGQIKFIFPNAYDVYLHGTPQTALFSSSRRTFSHGCIRIEDPEGLAAWLLHQERSWVHGKADAHTTRVMRIPGRLPVFVCYWTIWPGGDGVVEEVPDVYGYDRVLKQPGAPQPAGGARFLDEHQGHT